MKSFLLFVIKEKNRRKNSAVLGSYYLSTLIYFVNPLSFNNGLMLGALPVKSLNA